MFLKVYWLREKNGSDGTISLYKANVFDDYFIYPFVILLPDQVRVQAGEIGEPILILNGEIANLVDYQGSPKLISASYNIDIEHIENKDPRHVKDGYDIIGKIPTMLLLIFGAGLSHDEICRNLGMSKQSDLYWCWYYGTKKPGFITRKRIERLYSKFCNEPIDWIN